MKTVDNQGNWVGLARVDGHEYSIDYFSSPDHWQIAFDVVYRLVFLLNRFQQQDQRLRQSFQEAFKEPFGLTDEHYDTDDWGGASVFWRAFWDRQAFDLRMLKKCEDSLNECGERTGTKVLLIGMLIIPRSAHYVAETVKTNLKSLENSGAS